MNVKYDVLVGYNEITISFYNDSNQGRRFGNLLAKSSVYAVKDGRNCGNCKAIQHKYQSSILVIVFVTFYVQLIS